MKSVGSTMRIVAAAAFWASSVLAADLDPIVIKV